MQAYIEFEDSEGEDERRRRLYEIILDRTRYLKGWVSFAKFEAGVPLEEALSHAEEREPDAVLLEEQTEDRCVRSRGASPFRNLICLHFYLCLD